MDFCHLHTHTEYSLLDGTAGIKKLVTRVKELGMTSCAITDHGNMFGVCDFWRECKAQGIHPVIGCEVYMAPRSRNDKVHEIDNKINHLILLAENQKGYSNLIYLVSMANIEGFYYKPRIDFELLKEHSEGLIVLSACLAGEIPQALLNDDYEKAKKIALKYAAVFGKDNYFIEIQDHGLPEQKKIIPDLLKLADEVGLGLVATNDIHYLRKEDAKYQDVLMCIQTNKTIYEEDRMKFGTNEFYLKSAEEMNELFSYANGAIENTVKIAQRCNVEFDFKTRHLPSFIMPEPDNRDPYDYLCSLCDAGMKRCYGDNQSKELRARLEYELSVIKKMGFVDYFLIVSDFVNYAKTHDVMVGPGRGSAAGSVVSYTLGITAIDPIRYNLIFERFLNPERVSMPDIDIDFAPEGRKKIIDYVVEKYGADQVAQIVTFGTMKARLAIRDVGRALDIPYADVDAIAKMIPKDLDMTIEKALDISRELKLRYESDPQTKELIDTSRALEGLPRHTSTHAAGVVITGEPMVEYLPLVVNKDNFITTQFTKDTVENLGLLKMDFLGLNNLTVIATAGRIIEKTRGIEFNIENIDYDNKKVFELIANGNTDGVFQLESSGMTNFMTELRPDCLEDIVAGIALYRPGPMDQIPRYIENKKHPEKITYRHPLLENILDVTYGCIVYQEQVMEIVRVLGGYSLGMADMMRRIISKKKTEQMKEERQKFIYGSADGSLKGCIGNGIDEKTAIAIFDEISDFASYAFNKSHAVAYAFVAYQTAYLKAVYPIEFMAALISCTDDTVKINRYIVNCASMGIRLLPPDVNKSEDTFTIEGNNIRFGLSAVKNVGRGLMIKLTNERNNNGTYKSFADFVERMAGSDMNKRALEALIYAGAFDSMGIRRSQLIAVYESTVDSFARNAQENIAGQMSLLDNDASSDIVFPDTEEFDKMTLLRYEKQATGMYFSGNPIDFYAAKIANITDTNIGMILEANEQDSTSDIQTARDNASLGDGQRVVVCGVIEEMRKQTTKSNRMMGFATIEDAYGSIVCLFFQNAYDKYAGVLSEGNAIVVRGKISVKEDAAPEIIADSAELLDQARENPEHGRNRDRAGSVRVGNAKAKKLYIRMEKTEDDAFSRITEALAPYNGNTEVVVYFADTGKRCSVPRRYYFNNVPSSLADIKKIFGEENVRVN